MVNREEALMIAHRFFLNHAIDRNEVIYESNSAWLVFDCSLDNHRHSAMGLWIEKTFGQITRYVFPDQNTKRILENAT